MMTKNLPKNTACSRSVSLRCFAALAFLLMFAGLSPLWAQDSAPGMGSRVIRLSWTKDDYALRYEVLVEIEDDGIYRNVHREFTQGFSVEIPLPEGNYRFSVIPYDLLNRPGQPSEWISMEVRAILEPEPPEAETEEIVIDDLPPEEKKKTVDTYLSIAWMPVIPVHFTDNDQVFGETPSLPGVGIRLGFVSSQPGVLNPGLEFAMAWHGFSMTVPVEQTEYATISNSINSNLLVFNFNIVMQKYFFARALILSLRAGAGLTLQFDSHSSKYSDTEGNTFNYPNENDDRLFSQYAQATMGVSLAWLPRNHFFLEAGLDYSYFITQDNPGCFRPWIGMGCRF